MGWSSATELFDGAVDVALRYISIGNQTRVYTVVKDMYLMIDWEDWDTQDNSKYFDPYLMSVMYELGEISEEDYREVSK